MAFPYIFHSNFEGGTNGEWDSETDTGSLLDFPHYTTLAAQPGLGMPYNGAYCMRVQPGDTNDHTVTEGDMNIAAAGTAFVRFMLWHDLKATADDIFNILELQQAGGTVEGVVSLQITASTGLVEIGIGETAASTFVMGLQPRTWYSVELKALVDSGAPGDGTLDLYVNGTTSLQAITGLDQGAVGQGVLGTQNTLATTTGTILFDDLIMDDAQIGPPAYRFRDNVVLAKTGHAFVGSGKIENVTLMSGAGTDCVLTVYDSDEASSADEGNAVVELKNTANNELVDPAGMPVTITKGAYVTLSGTNPRGRLMMRSSTRSEGAMREHASRR